ncbi:response regulator [Chamaesiphon sp.]|uniref:response regulator n=1 Tax=Chamaesiphon sp. TaxID=2814140 RepID=UPI003593685C
MTIDAKFHRPKVASPGSVDTGANGNRMNRSIANPDQFSFAARGLPAKLLEHIQSGSTGYWQHQFDRLANREPPFYWNLGIANGKILYSGNRFWSVQMLLRVVGRYVLRTRSEAVQSQFDLIESRIQSQELNPAQLLAMMKQEQIVSEAQLLEALRIKILNDLDLYLLIGCGSARFIAADIDRQLPIVGFSPSVLLDEAQQRHVEWEQLRQQVPSMKLCPILNRAAMKKASLPDPQRRRIETLMQSEQSLSAIAEEMAKDNLEVAKMFAKLASMGLVEFKPPRKQTAASVMVIDDSPVLLAQFQHWVSALGYSVTICQDANTALAKILATKPAVVFIDINMPEISGFELVKQIRRHPDLMGISLAILTGEQKLSNKWRAKWSGCEFLTKPLTTGAIADFQVQLEELIPRLLSAAATPIEN